MGGQIRGRVDIWLPPSGNNEPRRDGFQQMFTALYKYHKYLETLGIVTEIARHGGSGGSAAHVNFYDETNPFRSNAWFVFRWNTHAGRAWPYYVYYQFNRCDVGDFNASPATPSNIFGGVGNYSWFGIGFQAAIGVGGDQNPWNGGGSLGTNTKGTPVWKIPTGGTAVHVFPRSNNLGGAHVTNKQNCAGVFLNDYNWAGSHRMHMWSDLDGLFWGWTGSNHNYWFYYQGLYTPRADLEPVTYPFAQISMNAGLSSGPYGDYPGTSNYQGGVYHPTLDVVRPARLSWFDEWWYIEHDTFLPGKKSLRSPYLLADSEQGDDENGYLGTIPWFKMTGLTVTQYHRPNPDYIWWYGYDMGYAKLLMPWKRDLVPFRNWTREGVDFVHMEVT